MESDMSRQEIASECRHITVIKRRGRSLRHRQKLQNDEGTMQQDLLHRHRQCHRAHVTDHLRHGRAEDDEAPAPPLLWFCGRPKMVAADRTLARNRPLCQFCCRIRKSRAIRGCRRESGFQWRCTPLNARIADKTVELPTQAGPPAAPIDLGIGRSRLKGERRRNDHDHCVFSQSLGHPAAVDGSGRDRISPLRCCLNFRRRPPEVSRVDAPGHSSAIPGAGAKSPSR